MNPFELFESPEVYKVVMLYFSRSRGLAIVGRHVAADRVEVIQLSGEVDPRTGNFTALDYSGPAGNGESPVITKHDFEKLVAFIEVKIDAQTRMSVVEPEALRSLRSRSISSEPSNYLQ
jgi:hypothetical protein